MMTKTTRSVYQLGVWNQAGARVLSFQSEAESRDAHQRHIQQGYTAWTVGCITPLSTQT